MRRLAGNHVFTAGSTIRRTLRWTFFIYLSFVLLCNVAGVLFNAHVNFDLGSQFGVAILFAVVLMLGNSADAEYRPGGARARGFVWCGR